MGLSRALALTDLATSLTSPTLDPMFEACLRAMSTPQRAIVYFDRFGERRFTSEHLDGLWGRPTHDAPLSFDAFHTPEGWSQLQGWTVHTNQRQSFASLSSQETLSVHITQANQTWTLRAHIQHMRSSQEDFGFLVTYERVTRSELEQMLDQLPLGIIFGTRGKTHTLNTKAQELLGITHLSAPSSPIGAHGLRGEILCAPHKPPQDMLAALRDAHRRTIFLSNDDDDTSQRRIIVQAHQLEPELELLVLDDVTLAHQRDKKRDELLSIASHELRNPLTPLKGLLQIARQQREHTGHVDGTLLQKAESQVSRIARLLDSLLDLSRLETGRMTGPLKRTDLVSLVRECVDIWGERHPIGRLNMELPDTPLYAEVYAPSIEQVLVNLLDNALKYSPAETPITISVTHQDGIASLSVSDQGRGMEPNVLDRVFERFFQGPRPPRQPSSLGLGLYVSRKIIEEHEGTIRIDSQLGHGTTVIVALELSSHDPI